MLTMILVDTCGETSPDQVKYYINILSSPNRRLLYQTTTVIFHLTTPHPHRSSRSQENRPVCPIWEETEKVCTVLQ